MDQLNLDGNRNEIRFKKQMTMDQLKLTRNRNEFKRRLYFAVDKPNLN